MSRKRFEKALRELIHQQKVYLRLLKISYFFKYYFSYFKNTTITICRGSIFYKKPKYLSSSIFFFNIENIAKIYIFCQCFGEIQLWYLVRLLKNFKIPFLQITNVRDLVIQNSKKNHTQKRWLDWKTPKLVFKK